VRTLGVTAAISLVVHGVALAWVLNSPKPEPAPMVGTQPVITIEPAPPEAELVIVDLVEPAPPAVPPPDRGESTTVDAPAAQRTRPRGTASIAASASRGSIEQPAGPSEPPPVAGPPPPPPGKKPKPTLSMRTGPQVRSTAEQMAEAALDLPPPGPLPDYPGNRAKNDLAIAKARGDIGGVVAAREELANQELKEQKDGTFTSEKTTFSAKVARDGTVTIRDKRNLQLSGLGARFDTTDWAMRAAGIDPYASAKREYLDRTRDQRAVIGKLYRKEQLARSAQLMQANLERLWRVSQDVAARKQAVFELWDDCAESGEDELVEGGAQARALLARWVQTKLTGDAAFTADELRNLNAKKRSKASFDPYH
jgi:hypothetical protein